MVSTGRPVGLAALAGLATLDEPVRRRLYDYVSEQGRAVSREDAAAAAGIGRTLAAYHLDKLAAAGLLEISYQRPPGRGGPGAGRPAKLYRRASRELSVSVPPRAYELLARLLAEAVERDPAGNVRATLGEVAMRAGREAGSQAGGDLLAALRECGYQPRTGPDGTVELANCPFHGLAATHRELVCGLNLRLIEGVLAGSEEAPARAVLSPRPGRCCVVVRPSGSPRSS
jgi:predicted ArsR family transcriptional regulator